MKKISALTLMLISIWATLVSTPAYSDSDRIHVASATTIENSGLYDAILPVFKQQTGIDVHVHSVGTGHAIKMARGGDADVLLGHHEPSEQQFVEEGFGIERFDLMYNDFVLVGPKDDPAGIRNTRNIHEAFELIAKSQSQFISRADESGTHIKEQSIWRDLSLDAAKASGDWYLETGGSMGATLNIANGMGAYTLSDRGTWLRFANRVHLKLLLEGDPILFNQYGVILVNPKAHPHTNTKGAAVFLQWLLSDRGQSAINSYSIDGEQAFYANAQWEMQLGQNMDPLAAVPRLSD